jgi:hypothetical protein
MKGPADFLTRLGGGLALLVLSGAAVRPPSAPQGHLEMPTPDGMAASTQPAADVSALPSEYSALQTRNPFAHGGKGGPAGPNAGGPGGPGAPGGPDTLFVLKGIVGEDGQFTAFVEDTTAKRVLELSSGAPLGRGRIKGIDADAIEYEAVGTSKRVEVGQDLSGKIVPPTPTSQPAPPQPPPGEGPQPGQPNGPMQGPGPGPRVRRGGGPPQPGQAAPEQPPQ